MNKRKIKSLERIAMKELKKSMKNYREVDREAYNLSCEDGFRVYDFFGNKRYYILKK